MSQLSPTLGLGDKMKYHDKYFHDDIIVSILAYCDNRANDNTIDIMSTKLLSAMQCYGCNLKFIAPRALPL